MTPIVLRPDQLQLKTDIYDAWAMVRHVMAVLPTGGGKSIVLSDIVLEKDQQGAWQCVTAHRVELVGQLSAHLARRGIYHRIIAPKNVVAAITQEHRAAFGRSYVNPDARCAVAGVDTLVARAASLAQWCAQIDYYYTDECHHVTGENKWIRAIRMFPNARSLGVTASPSRADGMGLGAWQSDGSKGDGIYERMVLGPDMRQLINMSPPALCDYQIACPETDFDIADDDLAPSGDWSPRKMREASQRSHIVGDTVQNYVRFAYGKRGICFATDVETSQEIAANFNAVGIPSAAVSAETPSDVRAEYIRRFRDGRIWMLVNVDLFGEGFDVPAVEVVIMARPTASLAVYLQQFGRALRVLAGKPFGLVIDQVSNWKRHGFPDKPHAWTLDRRDKRGKSAPDPEEIPLTACRSCSRPYERFHRACPHCGAEPPLPAPGGRSLQQVEGDLVLLDAAQLAAMRAATQLETPAAIAERVGHAAGEIAGKGAANRQISKWEAQERLKHAFAQWAAVQRQRGRSDVESQRRIYHALGVDMLTALRADQTRADMERTALIVEGWYTT